MNNFANVGFHPISIIGYLQCDLPYHIVACIEKEVQEMLDSNFQSANSYKENLAGAIEQEYRIYESTHLLEKFIQEVVPIYWKSVGNHERVNDHHIIRINEGQRDIWVNFSKKGEYNPLHTHMGLLSFVLWHKMPFTIEDEKNLPMVTGGTVNAGACFQFSFLEMDSKGAIGEHYIEADKRYENKMIIFPSNLAHIVYPFFTSDDYRISLSGNIEVP